MSRPAAAGMAAAGRAVRAWRADRTQQEVAGIAGINIDTLGDLEAGNTWPRNRTLRAVERAFGKPEGELDRIAWEADNPPAPATADRSPPVRLRKGSLAAIREDFAGDPVLAEQVIAYIEGVASGRIARADPGAHRPEDGEGRHREQA